MSDKRLIDANALMKNIGKIPQLRGITYGRMKKAVEETPTIDAVPVVRCKECRNSQKLKTCADQVYCMVWKSNPRTDGYCYLGAKMDGGATDGSDA